LLDTEDAIRSLRESGMRATPQRRAVIAALSGDTTHPIAEDVAARVALTTPGVSLSTVYKTLHELASIGLIRELDAGGAMRFDPETAHHAHLVCPACGAVEDFDAPLRALEQLREAAGVSGREVQVTLHAACSACSVSSAGSAP